MLCPHCASEVEPAAGRCPKCDRPLDPSADWDERPTELYSTDELADQTQIAAPTDHDETLFAGEGATVIDAPTSGQFDSQEEDHGEDGAAPLDQDATLLMGEGRTLLMGEEATLVGSEAPAPRTQPKKDSGPLQTGQTFGSRYHIIKLLGLGGMGAVYQAWDSELEVVVAIKVIRPEAAADPKMAAELDQRFKRELLLAREVTHKNVVRIHDLGEMEGIKYITMSFIEGEDLASILKREGKLPIPEALKITRDVVSGLVAAHEAGVVHRDLKPPNIMIGKADNNAYIMDFGIARSATDMVERAAALPVGDVPLPTRTTPVHGQTVAGTIVGTFEYMAPEQFRGEVADQRADLYTMGLILYDMLTGRRRSKSAHSAIAEVQKRTKEPPPPLREVDPEMPEPLAQLVAHCLEPDPNARFQTTTELEAALDLLDDDGTLKPVKRHLTWKHVTAAATVVVALLVGTFWFARSRAPEEAPEPMSILVADFHNDTGDASFDGALEQALNIAMEGAGFISAYSRPDAQEVAEQLQAGSALDENMARLVSRREGIDVVLSGQIEDSGSGYRVSVKALDAAVDSDDDKPLAKASAKAKDRDDVLAAIGRLASDLREDLGDTEAESSRMAAAETFTAASLDAMRAYAQGQELSSQGQFQEALGAYEEAVSLDPAFGRAYAGMGTVYGNLREQEKAEESYQKALQHLERMTERERYRTLGTYYLLVSRNYEKAIENYETLVDLFPADGVAHSNLALAYLNNRQFERAFEEGGVAVALDPNNFIKRINYAMYAMYAGEFEVSMEESRKVMEQNPSFGYAHFTLARSAIGAGELATAREAYAQLGAEELIGSELAPLGLGDLALYLGDVRGAIDVLEASVGSGAEGPVAAAQLVALSEAYLALGEYEYAKQVAGRAISMSSQESVLYPAGRVMIKVGDVGAAEGIAIDLENKLQSQTVSYARLIQGEIALENNRLLPAIEALKDGWERYDSWFAHYLLGRAYLEAEHYPEALGELEICLERQGEALDLFVVDGATSRYLAPVYYWLGRAREGVGSVVTARESYEQYLSLRGGAEPPDPLAEDAAQRLAALDLAAAS